MFWGIDFKDIVFVNYFADKNLCVNQNRIFK